MEQAHTYLTAWESFYVIVGSSGAALTGLQFVVVALAADANKQYAPRETIAAFGTPTIVHFSAVLLVSAIMSAPWQSLVKVSLALGACGLTGVVYGTYVLRRAQKQSGYDPVWEDWLFHAILPLVAYLLILIASVVLPFYPPRALFIVGAMALLLLFIGIHNAWDSVTYIAIELRGPKEPEGEASKNKDTEKSESKK